MVNANIFHDITLLSELMIIIIIKNAFDTFFFKLAHTEYILILDVIFEKLKYNITLNIKKHVPTKK